MSKDIYQKAMNHIAFSEDLDQKILRYVKNTENKKARRRKKWMASAVAAAACLVCLLAGILFFTGKDGAEIVQPGGGQGENQLPVITFSFAAEGAGGGEDFGFLVIKKGDSLKQGNPTLNNVDEIKQLPVFKQEKGKICAAIEDGVALKDIKKQMEFSQEKKESETFYSFDGKSGETYWNYFEGKEASLAEELLNYEFKRIEGVDRTSEEGNDSSLLNYYRIPGEKVGDYPIITGKEAEEKLRQGKFFAFGGEETVAKTAEILSVEITYMKDEYQTYIQPVYKFVITDKSWEKGLKTVMKENGCRNPGEFTSVSEVYVPALPDQYLKITEPELHMN
ncbi:hypothetical protein NE619_10165 [Anaerovorax odorimutans]|uniref:Sigma factor regulator C-terminal domain-containing protein n=1 Tax=Anaerovorax odorimutans TaxID=109327 RepID=A0ABT1RPH1_9FIRM|nr:hypothetical protein [Anaerovorax odorimutans]MCQ4637090.1 hypothetical protein [Anaerovorax odorimutans]